MKILCRVKQNRSRRPCVVGFHLCELSRIVRSIQRENYSGFQGLEERRDWVVTAVETCGVSFWGDEDVLGTKW